MKSIVVVLVVWRAVSSGYQIFHAAGCSAQNFTAR